MNYIGSLMMDVRYVLLSPKFPADPSGLLLFKNPHIFEPNILFGMNVYSQSSGVVVVPSGAGEQRIESYNLPLIAENIRTNQVLSMNGVIMIMPYAFFEQEYWRKEIRVEKQIKLPAIVKPILFIPSYKYSVVSVLSKPDSFGFAINLH